MSIIKFAYDIMIVIIIIIIIIICSSSSSIIINFFIIFVLPFSPDLMVLWCPSSSTVLQTHLSPSLPQRRMCSS